MIKPVKIKDKIDLSVDLLARIIFKFYHGKTPNAERLTQIKKDIETEMSK